MKILLVLPLLLLGCATQDFQSHCYHSALAACAIMESYGYQNRIAIQKTGRTSEGIYHAQCQAWDPEQSTWRWVVLDVYPTAAWGRQEMGDTIEYWTKEDALSITYNHALEGK